MFRFIPGFLVALVTAAAPALVLAIPAAAVTLDRSFGDRGTVITPIGDPVGGSTTNGNVWAMAEDRSGRIVAAGGLGPDAIVVRYLPNGRPDPSFGTGGRVTVPLVIRAFNPEKMSNQFRAVSILPSGKILLSGAETETGRVTPRNPSPYFVRLMPNGDLDNTFATFPNYGDEREPKVVLGGLPPSVGDMAVRRDGRVLVSGGMINSFNGKNRNLALISRFLPEPLSPPEESSELPLDPSFAPGSMIGSGMRQLVPGKWPFYSFFNELSQQPFGKTLVGGNHRSRYFVGRLTDRGTWDRSFGREKTGRVVVEIPNSDGKKCRCAIGSGMATDDRGRIVLAGWSFPDGRQQTMNVLRFKKNGQIDRSFGSRGMSKTRVNEYITVRRVAVDPSGKIFVAAWLGLGAESKFAIFAFKPNGKPLRSFFDEGRYVRSIGTTSTAEDVLIDRKGRLVVSGGSKKAGKANFVLKRFRIGS